MTPRVMAGTVLRNPREALPVPTNPKDVFDLAGSTLQLSRDNRVTLHEVVAGPPERYAGYSIGAPYMEQAPPHDGEVHPDGDEILFLVAGRVTVVIEDETPAREVRMSPGDWLIVPRGVWHKVRLDEPSRILHITPGPGGDFRPLVQAGDA